MTTVAKTDFSNVVGFNRTNEKSLISDIVPDDTDPSILTLGIAVRTLLDEGTVQAFGNQLQEEVLDRDPKPVAVVINMGQVMGLGANAIGKLITFRIKFSGSDEQPSTVYLSDIDPDILETFRKAGFHKKIFNIHRTEYGALDAARKGIFGSSIY